MINKFWLYKILLVLVLCVPQSILPVPAYMPKYAVLKHYIKKLPKPQFKTPSFKAMKLLSRSVAKTLRENWEDAAALTVILTIGSLAYKYWATDAQIKARYEAKFNAEAKSWLSENVDINTLTFPVYTATHMPDIESEDTEEQLDVHVPSHEFYHKISRGLFWDKHEIIVKKRKIPEERAAEREAREKDENSEAKRAFEENASRDPLAKRYSKPPEEYRGNWQGMGL